jgi:hypothetical protein
MVAYAHVSRSEDPCRIRIVRAWRIWFRFNNRLQWKSSGVDCDHITKLCMQGPTLIQVFGYCSSHMGLEGKQGKHPTIAERSIREPVRHNSKNSRNADDRHRNSNALIHIAARRVYSCVRMSMAIDGLVVVINHRAS